MTSVVIVHILWQGSTACGLWWGNAPKGHAWIAPWEWADLDEIAEKVAQEVEPCPDCAAAYDNTDGGWLEQWGDVLGS
jgi:hypothetical protein